MTAKADFFLHNNKLINHQVNSPCDLITYFLRKKTPKNQMGEMNFADKTSYANAREQQQ